MTKKTQKSIVSILALLAVVLFQGCSDEGQSDKTDTTQPLDTKLYTLELEIETNELPENNETTVTVRTFDWQEITSVKNIIWHISDGNVTAINGTKLIAKAEGTTTVRAQVGREYSPELKVTVYRAINGHRLPPEPNPTINNSTLLGIDSNNNGVRDDVERWVYHKVQKPVQHALLLQDARFFQLTLLQPVSKAKETQKNATRTIDCYIYLRHHDELIHSDEWRNINSEVENLTFNTKDRTKKYLDYNVALAGRSYGSSPPNWNEKACDFNATELLSK